VGVEYQTNFFFIEGLISLVCCEWVVTQGLNPLRCPA